MVGFLISLNPMYKPHWFSTESRA